MNPSTDSTNPAANGQRFVVKYENLAALYAGQTIVNATDQEVIVDFSSGPVTSNDQQVLSIHTRMAMSVEAARRLGHLLLQATENQPASDIAQLPGF
ncbi:hypothetical protein NHH03_21455 [Stieleria sp. TO1_6]|uniref:hypothetical protein n=1 Tax=Stieleria tagensis TaxID=2956795 RepID=UPI00209B72AC|nr:hypothetical protein [Stieleria tagensis]MCO8124322.1 hypothetical protein [Stieleria tagensis]